MKTYKCIIDDRWMWGLESACIMITSPRGGCATITKWHMNKVSDEEAEIIWKCANHQSNTIELTVDELKLLKSAAEKTTGYVRLGREQCRKENPKPQNQRKHKTKIDRDICCCGGQLRIKDHGSWEGFFCPKCESGGSRSKKNNKHY